MIDADTSPMAGAEMGTQTMGFQTQTSFPAVNSEEMLIGAQTHVDLNFFDSELLNQIQTNHNMGNVDITIQDSNNQMHPRGSVSTNHQGGQSSMQQIEHSRIVALLEPDKRLFTARKMDRQLVGKGMDSGRFVCLLLKDLVWIHNYLVQELISQKRDKSEVKMTLDGKQERKRRYVPNPKLIRNKILEPSNVKRLESKILGSVEKERRDTS